MGQDNGYYNLCTHLYPKSTSTIETPALSVKTGLGESQLRKEIHRTSGQNQDSSTSNHEEAATWEKIQQVESCHAFVAAGCTAASAAAHPHRSHAVRCHAPTAPSTVELPPHDEVEHCARSNKIEVELEMHMLNPGQLSCACSWTPLNGPTAV